jgi:ankyrin repeat protein
MSSTDDIQTYVRAAWFGDVEEMATATVRDVNVMGTVHGYNTGFHIGTALYFASSRGKLEAVRWLLGQEGIDVDRGNANGASPLRIASANSHEAVVGALITVGADVDRQDRWDRTALIAASSNGHTTIVRRLIAAGARVNRTSSYGWAALDYAQVEPRTATVEVLLAHRAMPGTYTSLPPLHARLVRPTDTDAPFALSPEEALPGVLSGTDVFGRTALHYAALTGARAAYAAIHSAMREAGLDTEGVDGGGYTASDHLVCVCLSTVDNFSHHSHPPATPQGFTRWSHRRSILRVLTAIGQVGPTLPRPIEDK